MHRHEHRHDRHARRGWGSEHGEHGRGWGHHHRGGGRRFFEQGDLRLVILALIAEKPRYGYELIKDVEERFGGAYAPSPGVIYPLLTMLEELGHVTMVSPDGGKKLYAITDDGKAAITTEKVTVDGLFARMAAARERFGASRSPQVQRATENLRLALRLRLERGNVTEEAAQAIAAAIDAAAQAIERT
jgi:DNA-binding PadR family transcriptional regulator